MQGWTCSTGCASACVGRYLFCAWAVPSKWDRLLLSVPNKVTLRWELGIKLAASVWLVEHVAASSTPQRNLIFPPSNAPMARATEATAQSPATQTSLCVAAKAGSPANDLANRMGTGRQLWGHEGATVIRSKVIDVLRVGANDCDVTPGYYVTEAEKKNHTCENCVSLRHPPEHYIFENVNQY